MVNYNLGANQRHLILLENTYSLLKWQQKAPVWSVHRLRILLVFTMQKSNVSVHAEMSGTVNRPHHDCTWSIFPKKNFKEFSETECEV